MSGVFIDSPDRSNQNCTISWDARYSLISSSWYSRSRSLFSRVPNKRGGVRIIGGLEMVRYNYNRGAWNNRGEGFLKK